MKSQKDIHLVEPSLLHVGIVLVALKLHFPLPVDIPREKKLNAVMNFNLAAQPVTQ